MWLKSTVMYVHENAMDSIPLIQSKNIKTTSKHIPYNKNTSKKIKVKI